MQRVYGGLGDLYKPDSLRMGGGFGPGGSGALPAKETLNTLPRANCKKEAVSNEQPHNNGSRLFFGSRLPAYF